MYDLRYLHQIDINLTDLCDKTCSFCPRHDPEVYPNNNQHMDFDLFKKIIQECLDQGYDKDILLCGRGEPSLYKHWEEALELVCHPNRTWSANVTTNGRKFDKYLDLYNNLDFLTLNTYTTQEEYDERVKKYGWKLKTSGVRGNTPRKIYNLEHYFKPDGASVDDINNDTANFPTGFELPSEPGVVWKHSFNSRCGLQVERKKNPRVKTPCIHPLKFMFLNFDGKIHMCCNDWGRKGGKNQTIVGDFTKDNIFQQYRRSRRRAKINHALLNGRRYLMEACRECDVYSKTDVSRVKNEMGKDTQLYNYLGKVMSSQSEYFRTDNDLEIIRR
tara:strand:- start:307 stop:1296 length:990 start_codon:yes stop_codon:yes gene_type:complete